jgi:hypothetical protein
VETIDVYSGDKDLKGGFKASFFSEEAPTIIALIPIGNLSWWEIGKWKSPGRRPTQEENYNV